MHRHDLRRSGHADTTGPSKNVTDLWVYEAAGSFAGAPAVVDNTVYAPGFNLYALSATDGSEKWRYDTNLKVVSSPAVVGNTIYAGIGQNIQALAIDDGGERWSVETGGNVVSSPAIADGSLFIGSEDGTVYAVSAADGTVQWRYDTDGPIVGSPAVVNGIVYIGSKDTNVYALDTRDGTNKWQFQTGDTVTSLAVVDGTVYICSPGDDVYAVSVEDGSKMWSRGINPTFSVSPAVVGDSILVTGVTRTESTVSRLFSLSAGDGSTIWRSKLDSAVFYSITCGNNNVYVSRNGAIDAFSISTGTRQWTYRMENVRVVGEPVVLDGRVYAGSLDANFYALTEK